MDKVVACIIARTVSTRLPLKILRDISPGISMIDLLISRLKLESSIDDIYICTSKDSKDDILVDIASRHNVKIYRGSEDEVTERIISVGLIEDADIVLRITGDNPLTSIEYISKQIQFLREKKLDYVRLVDVPIGATAEVIRYSALVKCHNSMDPKVSEYLMLFLFEPNNFKCGILKPFGHDYSNYSITVDTPEDLERLREILRISNEDFSSLSLKKVIEILENNNLPGKTLSHGSNVKMPYDKTISFEEFNLDMMRRKLNSELLEIC